MSNGGSISSMNSTLKNNRKNLRSVRSKGKFREGFDGKTSTKKKFKDKKVSYERLELIKYEIRLKKQKERRIKNTVFVCTLVVLSFIVITQIL